MSEYISREELIEGFKKAELSVDNIRMCTYPREEVMRIIYDMPSADVKENIHAHWKHDGSKWANRWLCSNCDYKLIDKQTNYCPMCGCQMDKPE